MRCIKLFLVCIFIFPCNSFSQVNLDSITIKDSVNNFNSIRKDELQFKNFFRGNSKKIMGIDDIYGLKLYGESLNDSLLSIKHYNLLLGSYSKEELTYFKESFQLLMELAKKDRNKYDLGVVGKYLGISRNIMAIILAIISVAK